MSDDTLDDLRRAVADLRRQLDERTAELFEALEQQTATAEVLQVINASPGKLAPVFDAMLQKAMTLCAADYGHIHTFDGQRFDCVAIQGDPEFVSWRRRRGPVRLEGGTSPLERLMTGESVVQYADALQEQAYRASSRYREMVDASGIRSTVAVALCKERTFLGAIIVYRREVRPFSDKQIALLQNFAQQAVIAMENARLITEQREALEQQTATSEVLGVINASPGNLVPVFDAILEKAMRLCGVAFGSLYTYDGAGFRSAAQRGVPDAYAAFREREPSTSTPGFARQRLLETARTVHILDVMDQEGYRSGHPGIRALVDLGGARTNLLVPLLKDGAVLGNLSFYRQEVRAFTERQITLLENFAAQAVIAIGAASFFRGSRAIPGTIPPTNQADKLSSTTAITVVF